MVCVLADACREYDNVNTAHSSCIRTDDLLALICEHVECESCSVVAFVSCLLEISEVGRYAGNALNAGLLVEEIIHLVCCISLILHEERNDSGIDVTCSCTHADTCKRCKTH